MTGYDAANPAGRTPSGEPGGERLGPHPPRMEPQTGAFPAPGHPAYRPPPTSSFPAVTSSQPAVSASGPPSGPPPGPFPAMSATPPPRRRGILGAVTLVLVVLLLGVVTVQSFLLFDLREKYDDLRDDDAAQRTAAQEQTRGLEERTKELERRAGNTLDAAAVAGTVLPSVFRVSSLSGSGTGFGFANESPEGGTYVITNYHVIDRNWESNQREVDLEQQNRRFKGQVVKVDEVADIAVIQTTDKFPRLAPAAEAARPGQPVVVVGSPLGLEDSVTSGVISALRTTSQGQVLQFDAPVNPGNSGGPIVNAQGQVVGVVNAKLRDAEGISLGIPVAVVCEKFGIC